jgi:hypothetical protein
VAIKLGRSSWPNERIGLKIVVPQRTCPLGRVAVEWMAAPWIAGVEIEPKKKEKDTRVN